jgi:hypothetical protein
MYSLEYNFTFTPFFQVVRSSHHFHSPYRVLFEAKFDKLQVVELFHYQAHAT